MAYDQRNNGHVRLASWRGAADSPRDEYAAAGADDPADDAYAEDWGRELRTARGSRGAAGAGEGRGRDRGRSGGAAGARADEYGDSYGYDAPADWGYDDPYGDDAEYGEPSGGQGRARSRRGHGRGRARGAATSREARGAAGARRGRGAAIERDAYAHDAAGYGVYQVPTPRRRRPLSIVAGLGLVVVVLAAAWGMKSLVGASSGQQQAEAHTAQIAYEGTLELERPATPRPQWKRGDLPWLYQTDSQWAGTSYAGADVKKSGCGPTCLTMVYIWATGKTDMTPADMARFSEQNGYVQDEMTAWALMDQGAAKLGLTSIGVQLNADAVKAALSAGQPVIVSVRPGTFTTVGHFMVLGGLTADGQVILHDPNSATNSLKYWDVQQILDEANVAWTYTLA